MGLGLGGMQGVPPSEEIFTTKIAFLHPDITNMFFGTIYTCLLYTLLGYKTHYHVSLVTIILHLSFTYFSYSIVTHSTHKCPNRTPHSYLKHLRIYTSVK